MVIYQQRTTVLDDFLLQIVFPWLMTLHVTPLLRLAKYWSVPIRPMRAVPSVSPPLKNALSNFGKIGG
ncbi:MAG TPA: hypothetical protein VMW65_09780 [Chloroflexota bacterium]|nr:hypothetical protein [Chloroflexota bacterium]